MARYRRSPGAFAAALEWRRLELRDRTSNPFACKQHMPYVGPCLWYGPSSYTLFGALTAQKPEIIQWPNWSQRQGLAVQTAAHLSAR